MRSITAGELALLRSGHFNQHLMVEVLDSGSEWRDLRDLLGSDWIVQATLDSDIDAPVMRGTVQFVRQGADASLSPFVEGSPLNRDATENYAPLLNTGRRVRLSHAATSHGVDPVAVDWKEVVQGKIDDVDLAASPSTFSFRDLGGYLADATIETPREYGSEGGTAVEVVMQAIIDDTLGAGAVTLITPDSPLWFIRPYRQASGVSVLDAISALALQIGWVVRYAYDSTGAFALTFRSPEREKSAADATFTADEYLEISDFTVSDADVRNAGVLTYLDAASGEQRFAFASDAGSIAEFGRRFIGIGEGAASNIDSEAEAQTMIDAAVQDLAQPKATHGMETFLWWPSQPGDLYTFSANGVHYDTDQTLAVVGIRHRWTGTGKARTTIIARGRVAGAYRAWLSTRGGEFAGEITHGPLPVIGTLGGEGTAFGGGPTREGMVWLPLRFTSGTDRILVYTVESATSPVPVPELSESRKAWEVRRPDGDLGNAEEWATWVMIATRAGYHRKVIALGLGPDGAKGPTVIREAQAVDVGAGPTAPPDALTVSSLADLNRVRFRVADPAASHLIFRNGSVLGEVPAHTYGAGTFAVFDDPGVDTSLPYTYDVCAFRSYQTSRFASEGSPPTQPPIADDDKAPAWVAGWPKQVPGIVPTVELRWTAHADTTSISVESRGSASGTWTSRFGPYTGADVLPAGTVQVLVFSVASLGQLRLVALFADGSRAYSAGITVGGSIAPLASPEWVGGYPVLVSDAIIVQVVEARWTLSDSRATKLELQVLTPTGGGSSSWVTEYETTTPADIASGQATITVPELRPCRLRATYAGGSTVSPQRIPVV